MLYNNHERGRTKKDGRNSRHMPYDLRLAMTLEILAGHVSVPAAAQRYGCGVSTVYAIELEVCGLIHQHIGPSYFDMPGIFEGVGNQRAAGPALAKVAHDFQMVAGANVPFTRIAAAIDGTAFFITRPGGSCSSVAAQYYSYKKRYCYGVTAAVDAQRRIRGLWSPLPGCAHDSAQLRASSLGAMLFAYKFADGYYLLGDSAYKCGDHVLTPFSRPADGSWNDGFNFHHSRLRMSVECAFGQLKNKFRIFKADLDGSSIERVKLIVAAGVLLHNISIDDRLREDDEPFETLHPSEPILPMLATAAVIPALRLPSAAT